MMRWLLLILVVSTLFLWLLLGCSDTAAMDAGGDGDSDSDSDGDTDADTDVDIIYPAYNSPYLGHTGAMTGPISPPPEDFGAGDVSTGPISPPPEDVAELGEIFAISADGPDTDDEKEDDWDAGVLEDGYDEEWD